MCNATSKDTYNEREKFNSVQIVNKCGAVTIMQITVNKCLANQLMAFKNGIANKYVISLCVKKGPFYYSVRGRNLKAT